MDKILRSNFKIQKTILKNNINNIKNIFSIFASKKNFNDSLTSNQKEDDLSRKYRNYRTLSDFDPDSEVLKFYKKYLNDEPNLSKTYYENLLNSKKEYIQKMNSSVEDKGLLNSISQSVNKNFNMMELKSELQQVIKIITTKISVSKESDLQEISEYYFKLGGKMIRPYLLILFSKYIYECENGEKGDYFSSNIHQKYVLPFAAAVEVLHNASLLHDDIIDNSDKRRNMATAHNLFGIRNTAYVPHYIISKSANLISDLDIGHLNEIYSLMVYHLTYGEYQQSLNTFEISNVDKAFQVYMLKTYYKTASLLALGLRGIGIIYKFDEAKQRKLFNLGLHTGVVFQLVDDVIDVIYDSSKSKKPSLKDLTEGIINSYVLFEINDELRKGQSNQMLEMAKRKFQQEGDIQKAVKILENGNGIIKTQNLSEDHLTECYKILNNPYFKNNSSKHTIYQCFDFLINRKY